MSVLEQPLTERLLENPLWHCFGHKAPAVDRATVSAMLDASQTRLLPVNTHTGRLIIGHGDVTWEDFSDEAHVRGLTPCLNVNLRETAKEAIRVVEWASWAAPEIDLLKMEVLDDDGSNNTALCAAAGVLVERGYTVMPLISSNLQAAQALVDIGCPILRVMGSPIGSGRGITRPGAVYAICQLGVPVVLDGGIGSLGDAKQALDLGCAGFLVNSALFAGGDRLGPAERLAQYKEVAECR